MDLTIIILHYKNIAKTVRCLDSIRGADLADLESEIIVVDNGSGDNIAGVLRARHPEARLIASARNLGMGGGNNLGLKEARGRFILVLNDDIEVSADAIFLLYNKMEGDDKIGIAAPKLLNSDATYQPSCFRFPELVTPLLRRTPAGRLFPRALKRYTMDDFDGSHERECDWVMGSCFMVRKSIIASIGWFDERFFMYCEDIDLCRRVRAAGFRVIYVSGASVIHAHGRGSAKRPWYIAPFTEKLAREHIKSWVKYFWKWKKHNSNTTN